MIKWMIRLVLAVTLAVAGVVVVRTLLVTPSGSDRSSGEVERIDEAVAVTHLSDALKFPTVTAAPGAPVDGNAFSGFVQFIRNSYPLLHQTLDQEQVDYSLLYTWRGSDSNLPGLLFIAHMDVVPVEPESEALWSHAPFSGDVADGFIWGRGAIDMKASVIGLLEAIEHLLRQGTQVRRTIFLALGTGRRNRRQEWRGPLGREAKVARGSA